MIGVTMIRTLPFAVLAVVATACTPPADDDRKYCDVVATEIQGGTTGTGVDIDGDGWLTICLRDGIVTLTTEG